MKVFNHTEGNSKNAQKYNGIPCKYYKGFVFPKYYNNRLNVNRLIDCILFQENETFDYKFDIDYTEDDFLDDFDDDIIITFANYWIPSSLFVNYITLDIVSTINEYIYRGYETVDIHDKINPDIVMKSLKESDDESTEESIDEPKSTGIVTKVLFTSLPLLAIGAYAYLKRKL